MSVPISFGDIIAAISLATNIWTTCFSSTSCAQLEYSKYGEQVKGLGNSLNSLYQILSDHENNLRRRGQKRQVDSMDLSSLADIVGDFEGTLRKTQSLLKKYAVFKEEGGRSYVKKIRWSLEAKSEVLGLTQDCSFHIAKIQFVIEPLKLKFLIDLSDQLEDVRSDLGGRIEQLESLIRELNGLPPNIKTLEAKPTADTKDDNTRAAASLVTPSLEYRFEEKLATHPRLQSILPEIPLHDWTEAAAWWIDHGTGQLSGRENHGSRIVPAELYLNLLKAAWILARCEGTPAYRRLEKHSLWCQYVCGLMGSIAAEIEGLSKQGLLTPDEGSLLRLPDDCFLIWLNNPDREVILSARDEKPGEEKILQLTLESNLDPERFTRELLIFRKDEDTLRLCDTTENFETGSRSSEEFIVICPETQLIAFYVSEYNRRTPTYSVRMKNSLQQKQYSFRSNTDLQGFQRAIVGSQVVFDQPGSRGVICASRIGSDQQGTNVWVQMWQDKPLKKHSTSSSSPNIGSSISVAYSPPSQYVSRAASGLSRTMTGFSSSSSGSSSQSHDTQEVMEFKLPTAPRLVIYYKMRDRWMYLITPMEDSLSIMPKRCCGNNMRRLFSGSNENCCKRTVLEQNKGTIDTLLFGPGRDEPGWALDVLQANVKRAKKHGEKVSFKYITIEFSSNLEKRQFNEAFEKVKKLRKAQRLKMDRQMADAKLQAHLHGVSRAVTWDQSSSCCTSTVSRSTYRS